MGRLKHHALGEVLLLRSRCLIGRSSTCDVRLNDARISGEHASVRWTARCRSAIAFGAGRLFPKGEFAAAIRRHPCVPSGFRRA
ncbi:FHA domain-containing protein [Sorangium sp. So ce185]|uniref:FHA domain-containing protein n=1 Tax=Sorangium sp. So ce185 TaxID=3133287 RepID=UPI003F5E30EA